MKPTPVLAHSAAAQASLIERHRDLDRASEPTERGPIVLRMVQHVTKFEGDPSCDVVRVYLALVWLEAGEMDNAESQLKQLTKLPQGSTRDIFNVATAKLLRMRGNDRQALDLLRPLSGKIVDEVERQVFLEELCRAAIGSKLDYEAMAYLDAWLRNSPTEDRARVRERERTLLNLVERAVLENTLRTMRSQPLRAGYSVDFQRVITEQLGEVAVAQGDAALARWLLESAAGPGSETDMPGLGQLAASRRGLRVVFGRTVGLLVTDGSTELRDRSAEVARGVSWSLGYTGDPQLARAPVRLVTRNDGGATSYADAALEEMAGEGVSLVIAGVDRASAERALTWCEAHGLPLILLSPAPAEPVRAGWLLGIHREAELTALASASASRGAPHLLVVTEAEGERMLDVNAVEAGGGVSLLGVASCDAASPKPGQPRFAFALAQKEKSGAVLVSGSRSCGNVVVDDAVRFAKGPLSMGFTMDAWPGRPAASRLARGSKITVMSTGAFPFASRTVPDDAELARYVKDYGTLPSFWAALGHDGGAIAKRAVFPLPQDDTRDDTQVSQRRAVVEAGLRVARAHLWTTTAEGFGNAHVIARTLSAVAIDENK